MSDRARATYKAICGAGGGGGMGFPLLLWSVSETRVDDEGMCRQGGTGVFLTLYGRGAGTVRTETGRRFDGLEADAAAADLFEARVAQARREGFVQQTREATPDRLGWVGVRKAPLPGLEDEIRAVAAVRGPVRPDDADFVALVAMLKEAPPALPEAGAPRMDMAA